MFLFPKKSKSTVCKKFNSIVQQEMSMELMIWRGSFQTTNSFSNGWRKVSSYIFSFSHAKVSRYSFLFKTKLQSQHLTSTWQNTSTFCGTTLYTERSSLSCLHFHSARDFSFCCVLIEFYYFQLEKKLINSKMNCNVQKHQQPSVTLHWF